MNDMSGNRFVAASAIDWLDYSLNEVLFNSFALERETDAKRILFYVTTILSSTGFRYGVNGFKYLAMLVTLYIIQSGYSEPSAVAAVADIYGTDTDEVTDSIAACIAINGRLRHTAAELLHIPLDNGECADMTTVVEIIGAVYKKYYNFMTADETVTDVRGVNYGRLVLNGK